MNTEHRRDASVRIMRLPEVISRVGLSRSAIYRRIDDGSFPAQVSLGGHKAVGWLSSDVENWIANLQASAVR